MISLRALALAAFGLIGGRPTEAPRPATVTEGTVLSLLVRPDTARVDVVVGIKGRVTTTDFTLHGPEKIVVDIANATLGMARNQSYDHAARGGIVNVHYGQFKPGVVRVVLTLDAPHGYHVAQESNGIRISVDGGSKLPAWAVGYINAARSAAPPAAIGPSVTTPILGQPAATSSSLAPAANKRAASSEATMFINGKLVPVTQTQSQAKRITVNFEDLPIADVLKVFAEYSGHSILAANGVRGNVSASIHDVPWDVALQAILNLNGYEASQDQYGMITVASQASKHQEQATQPMRTITIPFNYTSAATIEPMLKARLSRECPPVAQSSSGGTFLDLMAGAAAAADTSGRLRNTAQSQQQQQPQIVTTGNCPQRGAVTSDTLTNSVSVTDIEANLPLIEAYAATLDKRQPQVNIKAKIILVDRTQLEGLGLRYDLGSQTQFFNDLVPRLDSSGAAQGGSGQIALGGNAISAIANAGLRVPGAALQLAYSTALGAFDFTTFVEALTSTSLLDVQAEPNGTVLNNRTLMLSAGTDVPIRTTEPGAGGNSAGALPTVTVKIQPTGVILTVTPRVTNDNRVFMKVHVENSSVTFSGADATAFPKQEVDNEIMIADGATWVIGGLTQTSVTYTRTGIPLLVDLPIIGRLFGVTNRQEQKRDLLITLTPHVVDPGQDGGSGH
jgi:type IV pilus assembly protein PilQ